MSQQTAQRPTPNARHPTPAPCIRPCRMRSRTRVLVAHAFSTRAPGPSPSVAHALAARVLAHSPSVTHGFVAHALATRVLVAGALATRALVICALAYTLTHALAHARTSCCACSRMYPRIFLGKFSILPRASFVIHSLTHRLQPLQG